LKPTLRAYQARTKVTVTTEGAAFSPTTLARALVGFLMGGEKKREKKE